MRGSWMMCWMMLVVPMAQAAPTEEIPEELQAELATLIGGAQVERAEPGELQGAHHLVLAQHSAVAVVNLRAERGRWPTTLAELGELSTRNFDTTRFCSWKAREREAQGLEFESVAREESGACGPPVRAQLSAIDIAAGEWRFDYLTGPAVGALDPADAQLLEILQAALTGQTIRSGRQAPRIDRYEVVLPRKP